jgi:hypothetical protein
MKLKILALSFILTGTSLVADSSRKEAIIQELLVIQEVDIYLKNVVKNSVEMTRNQMFAQAGENADNPLMIRLIDRSLEKFSAWMSEQYSWDIWEPYYIGLYEDLFTEEELVGILEFYRTDAGKALVRSFPEITRRAQEKMFENSAESSAMVDKIMQDTIAEIQEEERAAGRYP